MQSYEKVIIVEGESIIREVGDGFPERILFGLKCEGLVVNPIVGVRDWRGACGVRDPICVSNYSMCKGPGQKGIHFHEAERRLLKLRHHEEVRACWEMRMQGYTGDRLSNTMWPDEEF